MVEPMRVGVLEDFVCVDDARQALADALRYSFDEAYEDGIIDRPVELIKRTVDGMPRGTTHAVLEAWKDLAAEGVLAISGPFISDNAAAIRSYIDDFGRVPSISWTGTDAWYGEYCFCINNGSLPEDGFFMANFLIESGVGAVAVIYDDSLIGHGFLDGFRAGCAFEGVKIIREGAVPVLGTDPTPILELFRSENPGALVYCGVGIAAIAITEALARMDWDPLRVMTTGFQMGPAIPQGLHALKGWVGGDQYDDENPVAQDFLDSFEKKYGYRPANYLALLNYDCGQVISHALAKAQPLSPEGVKRGLEKVKMIPAATGGAGGVLGFAPYVRRAWTHPQFLLWREVDPNLEGPISAKAGPGTVLRHRLRPRTRTERLSSRRV